MDLFDYKPRLKDLRQHRTARFDPRGPAADRHDRRRRPAFRWRRRCSSSQQHGKSGAWVSELMPHTGQSRRRAVLHQVDAHRADQSRSGDDVLPDRLPACRPAVSIGAWLAYGLGSENKDLPAFVVMISQGSGNPNDQPLADRLWGSGFLPTKYQGVKFRSGGDPVLYLSEPARLRPARRGGASSTTWRS